MVQRKTHNKKQVEERSRDTVMGKVDARSRLETLHK